MDQDPQDRQDSALSQESLRTDGSDKIDFTGVHGVMSVNLYSVLCMFGVLTSVAKTLTWKV